MQDMDYQPDLLAGSLRRGKTGTIGLIIPDSANALFANMSKEIEDILFLQSYNVIVCNFDYDIGREVEYLKTQRSKMVERASNLLLKRIIESDFKRRNKIVIPTELIVRESTARVKISA